MPLDLNLNRFTTQKKTLVRFHSMGKCRLKPAN